MLIHLSTHYSLRQATSYFSKTISEHATDFLLTTNDVYFPKVHKIKCVRRLKHSATYMNNSATSTTVPVTSNKLCYNI